MLVAVAQLTSSADLLANGIAASELIKDAAAKGARIIFLPEAADYLATSVQHGQSIVQPFEKSPFITTIQSTQKSLLSQNNPIDVVVGIHEPSTETPGKVKNTCVYLDSNGSLVYRYQKIHLFDVDIPDGPIFRESDSIEPGNELPVIVNTPAGNLGIGICYDLRFPELAQYNTKIGAQLQTFPAAWTCKTGPHFQILAKSTAIQTQCYLIMPAQTGVHEGGRVSWGHSCIIDPWGEIIANVEGVGIAIADIDLNLVKSIRDKMPLQNQRRLESLK